MADRVAAQQAALMAKAAHWKQLDQQRRGGGFLDDSTTSRPVVGQNIVVGSRKHNPTKRLVRPPHEMPPAKWHLSPNLDADGPLSKDQVQTFFEDGAWRQRPTSPLPASPPRWLLRRITWGVSRLAGAAPPC